MSQEQPVEAKYMCALCGKTMGAEEDGVANKDGKIRVCIPCTRAACRAIKDPRISGIKVIDFSLYRILENHRG